MITIFKSRMRMACIVDNDDDGNYGGNVDDGNKPDGDD